MAAISIPATTAAADDRDEEKEEEEKEGVVIQMPQASIRKMSSMPGMIQVVEEENAAAARATETEHQMGFRRSLRMYRKAVFWSVAMSTAIVMEGFDINLLNSLYGFPSFQRKFGGR